MIKFHLHKKLNATSGIMLLEVNLEIEQGTFITIYGKSGAGKTSVLRMLAGLLKPDQGQIIINDTTWFDWQKKINLSPQKRKVGLVFQDYSLFPNMTVRQNLEFALSKNQDDKIIDELIEIIELGNLSKLKTTKLSGGQQQRIALARALVQKPELLLLDEPLSALDQEMRFKLQEYLLKVHREYNLTTILVSHDVSEISKLSDTVLLLEDGKVTQKDTPQNIFREKMGFENFQLSGELMDIEKKELIYLLKIRIGTDIITIKATENQVHNLKIRDTVYLDFQASNLTVYPRK